MKILDNRQIRQKIRRLAIEILERHTEERELILAGLNNNGVIFADLLVQELLAMTPSELDLTVTRIRVNPANPLEFPPTIEMPAESLAGKAIILVDDVANTGRTFFYAAKPLLDVLPKKVEVAVLVDRKHKSFPVKTDYVGLSLATTMLDNIRVELDGEMGAYLE